MKIPTTTDTPYRGLAPYDEDDAPYFFGRDREREIISANLLTKRLTVLYGPSGVGKSSVLHAGVVPHLRSLTYMRRLEREKFAPTFAGFNDGRDAFESNSSQDEKGEDDEGEEYVIVVFKSWRDEDPLLGLLDAVSMAVKGEPVSEDEPRRLTRKLRELTEGTRIELLIILDQFEDYFLFHAEEGNEATFASEFPRAVIYPQLPVNFLISIREDWLARLDLFTGYIPRLFDNRIRIEHLDRNAAAEAIASPVAKYNLTRSEGEPEVAILEPFTQRLLNQLEKLDERVLNQSGNSATGGEELPIGTKKRVQQGQAKKGIQTPFLQIVMLRLWGEALAQTPPALLPQMLDKPHTAREIVQSHLDDLMDKLTADEQRIAAGIFRYLVLPSGGRLPLYDSDMAKLAGVEVADLAPVIRKLSDKDYRILGNVPPGPGQPQTPRYEIVHDVLARPVLKWTKRYEWVRRGRESEATAALQKRREAARARARWLRIIIGILTGALISMLALLLIMYGQWQALSDALAEGKAKEERVNTLLADVAREVETVRKLDKAVPYSIEVLRGHDEAVTSAAFSPDGSHIATSSRDKTARIWNTGNTYWPRVLTGHAAAVTRIVFSPDGQRVLTASEDTTARVWDSKTGELLHQLRGHAGRLTDAAYSPDGSLIATADDAGVLILWNADGVRRASPARGHAGRINRLAFSSDGKLLATAGDDKVARVWNFSTGQPPLELRGHTEKVNVVVFDSGDDRVLTASDDATARFWDAGSGQHIRTLAGHDGAVNSAAFSPDGKFVVTGSEDNTALIWDSQTGVKIETLSGHTGGVLSAQFDKDDGTRIITSGKDSTARVWTRGGRSLAELRGHAGEVSLATFRPDSRVALTISSDKTARLWSVPDRGGFEVGDPEISVEPSSHYGHCPVTVKLTAKIRVVSGSGEVAYKFVRGDGREVGGTLFFEGPGEKFVSSLWKIRAARKSAYRGRARIKIIEPNETESREVRFLVRCHEPAPPQDNSVEETPQPSP